AILDADKEGFLRSTRSLIQTIGRAARNVSGQVIMYADKVTASMEQALAETNRRRAKQQEWNTAQGIDPQPLRKKIADITDMLGREQAETDALLAQAAGVQARAHRPARTGVAPVDDLQSLIAELTDQMHEAARELNFEIAARLRDEVGDLRKELRSMLAATSGGRG
ncbi:MAG: excinuclease ABC subunit B, partial [Actinobacteria bacterium]|nr:excinuclease ABC subunit B [Actinomycetota bacterium]